MTKIKATESKGTLHVTPIDINKLEKQLSAVEDGQIVINSVFVMKLNDLIKAHNKLVKEYPNVNQPL